MRAASILANLNKNLRRTLGSFLQMGEYEVPQNIKKIAGQINDYNNHWENVMKFVQEFVSSYFL